MRLSAENLAGERGGETIFAGVSFTLADGDALLVTGPNGAGKTTLMRVLAGLLPASAGSVRLDGGGDAFPDVASAVHFLGPVNAMKTALSVGENLAFWQAFAGAPDLAIDDALDAVGLPGIGHLPFGALSTGQKRRVAIARLLVNRRPVWLVDEPTSGLDKRSEDRFSAMLKRHLASGGILVASTHLPLGLDGAQTLEMGRWPAAQRRVNPPGSALPPERSP